MVGAQEIFAYCINALIIYSPTQISEDANLGYAMDSQIKYKLITPDLKNNQGKAKISVKERYWIIKLLSFTFLFH